MKGLFGVARPGLNEPVTQSVPLVAVYAIAERSAERCARIPLGFSDAFAFLNSQIHRAVAGQRLGLTERLLQQTCWLATAVPVYRLDRPRSFDRLGEATALIESALIESALLESSA
jgi:hypothetical protein